MLFILGPEFEERIRGNEADNPKFNFLNPNDPYHAYYAHKLKEYQETDIADLRKTLLIIRVPPASYFLYFFANINTFLY